MTSTTSADDDPDEAGPLQHRVVQRSPIVDHDGESGATLERARLDDGTRLVLKTFDPEHDLTMLVPARTVPLDVGLWRDGVLAALPPSIGHAVRDAWQEDGEWVVAMDDLAGRLLSYTSRLTRQDVRDLLAPAIGMHRAFLGRVPDGVWDLGDRLTLFAPRVIGPYRGSENRLPDWCLQGWEYFDELAPAAVVDLVHAVHDSPALLTEPLLRRGGETLLHGDYWTPNLAPGPDRVVVIDWALATRGPSVVEATSFLVGCADQVDATRDELLDDLRALWGDDHDEPLLRVALAGGVVEMGWNLAWYAATTPTAQARAAFDWWVAAAQQALATGLLG